MKHLSASEWAIARHFLFTLFTNVEAWLTGPVDAAPAADSEAVEEPDIDQILRWRQRGALDGIALEGYLHYF